MVYAHWCNTRVKVRCICGKYCSLRELPNSLKAQNSKSAREKGFPKVGNCECRATDLNSKEHTSNWCSKCASYSDCYRSSKELVFERLVCLQLLVWQETCDASRNVYKWSFLSQTHSTGEHSNHAKYLADVGFKAKHVWQPYSCHDGSHLRNSTALS
jgi:hypothetical protein